MDHVDNAHPTLTPRQVGMAIIMGALLWLIAALLLRQLVPAGAFGGSLAIASYALVVPGTVPFIVATRICLRLQRHQLPIAVCIVTASALLLDGVVVRWFPSVYGSTAAEVATAAGAVLWGAGVGLALGVVMGRK